MATLARHLMTAEEFLGIEFDGEARFELDNGVVRMMAGGLAVHARVQSNVMISLGIKLRGTGCTPYGPDMAVTTHKLSVRYPDITIYCDKDSPENDRLKAFDDPKLIVKVLSESTRQEDIKVKLPEYRAIASLDAILYIDPEDKTVHLETRDPKRGWTVTTPEVGERFTLPLHDIELTWEDIFGAGTV
jgi:Uma2 family endonuclease